MEPPLGLMLELLMVCLLLAPWCCDAVMAESKIPKVCAVNAGCLVGKFMPGYQTEKFEAFLGIPYALPPLGELRFSNPKAYPRWPGVLDATEAKADCMQKNDLLPNPTVQGVEDCLYLNVYRPAVRTEQPLPVMVYIYGGGWFAGTANPLVVGPEYFMDTQEVILVTFAYRLGALGFLSTNDINMPGNFGLKDQNLALRWVQKNIGSFGGNPGRVTLFGQSAGAVSAHMHMLSKQSEGLFSGIIAQSGTANVPFGITMDPLTQARKTAELCNITDFDSLSTAKLTRALRSVDAASLVKAGDGLKYWDVDHLTNYRPVIESTGAPDAFLTQHPKHLLAAGNYKPVPWLATVVPQEGAVRALAIMENDALRVAFNENFDELFQKLLDLPAHFTAEQLTKKMRRITDEYFQGVHELNENTVQGFLDTITDRGFHHPFFNAIKQHVNQVDAQKYPVYLYKFNYKGPHTYANIYTGKPSMRDYGVVHCDDLIYLFRSPVIFPDFEKDSVHAKVVKDYVGAFVHFAKFGKPQSVNQLKPCLKTSFNPEPDTICEYQEFVNVGPNSFEIKTETAFNVKRMQMWDNILGDA